MAMPTRPVWAEISLDRLVQNFRLLHSTAVSSFPEAPPELLAVVKADAYGHGVHLCGPALAAAGARWLGVTCVDEGEALRRALGILPGPLARTRILVMSSLWQGEADAILDRALTPVVWEPYQLALLEGAAALRGLPAGTVPVHLEIDSGMARQGIAPGAQLAALLQEHFHLGSPLLLEGVMTHFSAPEVLPNAGQPKTGQPDTPTDTEDQIARLAEALLQLQAAGLRPSWLHAGNSATVFDPRHTAVLASLARTHGARLMLRPGLALYGYPVRFAPSEPPSSQPNQQTRLRPVLAWKTRISSLRELASGQGAGYNSIFRATRPTCLALTPVGYADGVNRLLSNPTPSQSSTMLVRGRRAPIAGRISMDQTILDVTEIPNAMIGDEVVILGEQATGDQAGHQGAEIITAWEHADLCGTIPYEVLCNIAGRVPRVVL
jgi:alanine racemase